MTLHVTVFPSTVAVIVHSPGIRAVTIPLCVTVAILGLLLRHHTAAVEGAPSTYRLNVSYCSSVVDDLLIAIE